MVRIKCTRRRAALAQAVLNRPSACRWKLLCQAFEGIDWRHLEKLGVGICVRKQAVGALVPVGIVEHWVVTWRATKQGGNARVVGLDYSNNLIIIKVLMLANECRDVLSGGDSIRVQVNPTDALNLVHTYCAKSTLVGSPRFQHPFFMVLFCS